MNRGCFREMTSIHGVIRALSLLPIQICHDQNRKSGGGRKNFGHYSGVE